MMAGRVSAVSPTAVAGDYMPMVALLSTRTERENDEVCDAITKMMMMVMMIKW